MRDFLNALGHGTNYSAEPRLLLTPTGLYTLDTLGAARGPYILARASAAGADHEGDCDVLLRIASERWL